MTARSRTERRADARKQRKLAVRADAAAPPPSPPDDDVPEPRFFFGFTVPAGKLAFARFWVFGLLALDALRQIPHAPRYGAGGFNVGHIPGLDGLAPGREPFVAIQIALVLVLGAIAAGAGSRITVAITAAIYGWVYLSSQLDAYQHHYLVALVLGLACAVPWFGDAEPRTRPVRTWAVRVILLQLGIVYLWAAIAKLDPRWLDGSALAAQLQPGFARDVVEVISFPVASGLIVVVELFLAFAIWIRRLWPIAFPLGVAFHAGIATTSLEIGLFAWLMVALYALIIPDRWFHRVARWLPRELPASKLTWLAVALPLAGAAIVLPMRLAIDGVAIGAVAGVAIVIADQARQPARRYRLQAPVALAVIGGAIAVLGPLHRVTNDYYKYWGGSTRRLAGDDAARAIYERMIDAVPDDPQGHYQLGKLLLASNPERGVRELRIAQALEPDRARAFVEEARHRATTGDHAGALERAKAALAAEPTSPDAAALVVELDRR